MTTSAEIRRWTRPLTERRKDLVLRGRSLVVLPLHHVYRSIFFEGSWDRTYPRPRWSFAPVFCPPGLPVRTWSAELPVGRSTDEAFADRVLTEFTNKIDNDLGPVTSVEAFYEMTLEYRPHEAGAGLWQLASNPEYHACVLAAMGRMAEAHQVAEGCLTRIGAVQEALEEGRALMTRRPHSATGKRVVAYAAFRLALLSELQRLATLAKAADRAGMAALLHEWEEQKVRLWKIEDLWEPTPFPIELGADR
jgi:hypothetical protein